MSSSPTRARSTRLVRAHPVEEFAKENDIGVATWALSPIKFQADMGVLLAFMFIVNMIGALVLLPARAQTPTCGQFRGGSVRQGRNRSGVGWPMRCPPGTRIEVYSSGLSV